MRNTRSTIAGLALSAAALVALAISEGYTDRAIIPTRGDVPTYGFGSTTKIDGSPVKMGDSTSPVKALQRKLAYIQQGEARMKRCVTAPVSQAEYDVYVDVFYNIGPGAFCASTIVKRLNASDYKGACDAILLFNRVGKQRCDVPGNKVCGGLWKRRLDLHAQCMAAQ